jgi:hypothetical protein
MCLQVSQMRLRSDRKGRANANIAGSAAVARTPIDEDIGENRSINDAAQPPVRTVADSRVIMLEEREL